MTISAILAMSQNRVIGKDNDLPWDLPEDFKFFKSKTLNHPIIMGRKTWESMGKSLPQRTNIVITRNTGWYGDENAHCVPDLDAAMGIAQKSQGSEEIFIIGGAGIIEMALPKIDRFYLTVIHHNVEGDVYLPTFEHEFREVARRDRDKPYPFSFITYERQ